ncbi:MAG: M23 family metallopeptidase [Alphaproteobacteria bacterium]
MRVLPASIFVALVLALAQPAAAHDKPLEARNLTLTGQRVQGGVLIGRTEPGARLTLDGGELRVSPEGNFVFGFGRKAAPRAVLKVRYADGAVEEHALAVKARKYKVERIEGLPPKMVTPSERDLVRIRADHKLIKAARKRDIAAPYFAGGFDWPVRGRISGVYGSQRILNGKPKNPHTGIDVAAPTGTLIVAPAAGEVTLAHPDMYYTGMTVILDHGHGLSSYLIHMSAILVKAGDRVKKGDPIGRVGATGRVTGPHLHWGMNWRKARLDPRLVVGPMPKSAAAAN